MGPTREPSRGKKDESGRVKEKEEEGRQMMRTGREERQEERGNYGGTVGGKRKEASAVEMEGSKEGGAVGKRKKNVTKGKIVEKKETTK